MASTPIVMGGVLARGQIGGGGAWIAVAGEMLVKTVSQFQFAKVLNLMLTEVSYQKVNHR